MHKKKISNSVGDNVNKMIQTLKTNDNNMGVGPGSPSWWMRLSSYMSKTETNKVKKVEIVIGLVIN